MKEEEEKTEPQDYVLEIMQQDEMCRSPRHEVSSCAVGGT